MPNINLGQQHVDRLRLSVGWVRSATASPPTTTRCRGTDASALRAFLARFRRRAGNILPSVRRMVSASPNERTHIIHHLDAWCEPAGGRHRHGEGVPGHSGQVT
jgi:hypothetical protein